MRNRIHTVVDRLLPGFLDQNKSGIIPFSDSSLYLMQDRFSAPQIRRRRRASLVRELKKHGTLKAEQVAAKLQQCAAQALTTPDEYSAALQICLTNHVGHYRCLLNGAEQLVKEMALLPAGTQGAFLTSIKGVGIVLAAGVTAEIGDPLAQRSVTKLASYAGIIPKVKQSGFGMGRRFVRMAMCLMRTCQIYLPPEFRGTDVQAELRAGYYLSVWPDLKDKRSKAGALAIAFDNDKPLGQWRHIVQQLYGIRLKL